MRREVKKECSMEREREREKERNKQRKKGRKKIKGMNFGNIGEGNRHWREAKGEKGG